MRVADCLAVAVAISLPWSTSATGILIVLWLIALAPTLDLAAIRREVMTPAGGLPVLPRSDQKPALQRLRSSWRLVIPPIAATMRPYGAFRRWGSGGWSGHHA